MSMIMMLVFVIGILVVTSSCSSNDDDSSYSSDKVTITYTKGSKTQAHYKYTFYVKYSGNSSDVKVIGLHWGKGSATQNTSSNTTSSKTFTKNIDLYDGINYAIEGFVKLKSGQTITSKSVRVTP